MEKMVPHAALHQRPDGLRVSVVNHSDDLRAVKQRLLGASNQRAELVAAHDDVRVACGFLPMNVKGLVANWRGL